MRGHRRRWISFLIAIAALPTTAVRAETPPLPDADPDTEIARRHFDKGTAFYNEGKYLEAIAEFEAARKVKPRAAFDFNIARAHDRMEHTREAIDAYKRYLAGAPGASDAVEVRARIAELGKRLRESSMTPPPAHGLSSSEAVPRGQSSRPREIAPRAMEPTELEPTHPPGRIPVRFIGKNANDRFIITVGSDTCAAPCTLYLRPERHRITVGGDASFRRFIEIPPYPVTVRVQRISIAAYTMGAILTTGGAVALGCFGWILNDYLNNNTPSNSVIPIYELYGTGLLGAGAFVTGLLLLGSGGRNHVSIAGGNPEHETAATLRLSGFGIAPLRDGMGAMASFSF